MTKLSRSLFLISVLIITASYCRAQSASKPPDLSGSWSFNAQESKFSGGKFNDNVRVNAEIVQTGPEIAFQMSEDLSDGQKRPMESSVFYCDGRGETNHRASGTVASTTKWDGNKLVVTISTEKKDNKEKEEWWLSNDNNRLFRKITRTSKIVYKLNEKVTGEDTIKSEILYVFDRIGAAPSK